MSTAAAAASKSLNKKELKKFQELLEEKRKAVLERARQMLAVENTRDVVGEILDRHPLWIARRRGAAVSSIMRMETKPIG